MKWPWLLVALGGLTSFVLLAAIGAFVVDGGEVDAVSRSVPSTTTQLDRTSASTVSTTTASVTTTSTTSTTAPPATVLPTTARALAETLLSRVPVAEEDDRAGYDRGLFEHWIDADGDGCNTRCEVLLRQQLPDGGWFSTYDRTHVAHSSDLDVDHVVALAEAWRSGASTWDAARRRDFANDLDEPLALIAVSGSSNRSKSDRDPSSWRPAAE